jgi:hypothetical protein
MEYSNTTIKQQQILSGHLYCSNYLNCQAYFSGQGKSLNLSVTPSNSIGGIVNNMFDAAYLKNELYSYLHSNWLVSQLVKLYFKYVAMYTEQYFASNGNIITLKEVFSQMRIPHSTTIHTEDFPFKSPYTGKTHYFCQINPKQNDLTTKDKTARVADAILGALNNSAGTAPQDVQKKYDNINEEYLEKIN